MPGRAYNARKNFGWKLLIDGVLQAEIQEVDLPEPEITAVKHGDVNSKIGTPGDINYGDMVVRKLLPVLAQDRFFRTWMDECANQVTGAGLPIGYERVMTFLELGPDRIAVVGTHIISGWPRKKSRRGHSRSADAANIVEEVTFEVNNYEEL